MGLAGGLATNGGAASGGEAVTNGLCAAGSLAGVTSSHALVANHVVANRITVPKAGTLHDVAIFVVGQSGNVIVAVYDTGDALAGSRSKLWDSGSVACGAANAWQVVGDPALTVKSGQQLDLTVMADNATATFAVWANLGTTNKMNQLPTNYIPAAGGASPKQSWEFAAGSFAAPATVTEAQCGVIANQAFVVIARVA